ncbi:uncharacterized protein BCR38DRAFT_510161, partial [Pseudomassariella vexata]
FNSIILHFGYHILNARSTTSLSTRSHQNTTAYYVSMRLKLSSSSPRPSLGYGIPILHNFGDRLVRHLTESGDTPLSGTLILNHTADPSIPPWSKVLSGCECFLMGLNHPLRSSWSMKPTKEMNSSNFLSFLSMDRIAIIGICRLLQECPDRGGTSRRFLDSWGLMLWMPTMGLGVGQDRNIGLGTVVGSYKVEMMVALFGGEVQASRFLGEFLLGDADLLVDGTGKGAVEGDLLNP